LKSFRRAVPVTVLWLRRSSFAELRARVSTSNRNRPFRHTGNERVPQVHHFPVYSYGLHGPVSGVENGSSGSLIHSPGFHPHVPVFHQIHSSDPVFSPIRFSRASSWAGDIRFPLTATGFPFSKSISTEVGLSGAFSGEQERTNISRAAHSRDPPGCPLKANVKQVPVTAVGFLR